MEHSEAGAATTQAEITLDEVAREKARNLALENQQWQGLPLRLYIEGKGCDGFYYGVAFDQAREDDQHFPQGDAPGVVADPDTIQFVMGAKITWVDDERGQGFLVENPRHQEFRGKFYKRKTWQERLLQKSPPEMVRDEAQVGRSSGS